MTYLILIAASFVAALVSGAAGFGGALILLPIVTACVGARVAVPLLTLAQLIGNVSRMATGLRQIRWDAVGWYLLTALPLSALGAFGFSVLPKDIVTRCIGAALLLLVIFKMMKVVELKGSRRTLLIGGAITGGVSGLAGSGGPIGAAVFLSLGLPPVAYIASEAATATAMHVLKTIVYSRLASLSPATLATGLVMGGAMVGGTVVANRFIRNMDKGRFQKYVAVLLCVVGAYMLVAGG
ncbi:MAG: sulfite exporter TauE/SafE family protein [Syntrophomonadaceae bacterium]|nr:sulfite exporter TauE/SafE family protein [Syntrophomonadaceae bacterium]MDH7497995.1 sulfite exporter TauE/SafE family protein [Syntrophomonadaceae bacterium]